MPAGFAVDLALIDLHDIVVHRLPEMQPRFRIHVDGKFIFAHRDDVAGIAHDLAVVVERGLLPMLGRYESSQAFWDDALPVLLSASPEASWPLPSLFPAIVAGKLLGDARHRDLARRELTRRTDELNAVAPGMPLRSRAENSLRDFKEFMDAVGVD